MDVVEKAFAFSTTSIFFLSLSLWIRPANVVFLKGGLCVFAQGFHSLFPCTVVSLLLLWRWPNTVVSLHSWCSLFLKRRNSEWSLEWKSEIVNDWTSCFFLNWPFENWPVATFRISIFIPMTISSLIFAGTDYIISVYFYSRGAALGLNEGGPLRKSRWNISKSYSTPWQLLLLREHQLLTSSTHP